MDIHRLSIVFKKLGLHLVGQCRSQSLLLDLRSTPIRLLNTTAPRYGSSSSSESSSDSDSDDPFKSQRSKTIRGRTPPNPKLKDVFPPQKVNSAEFGMKNRKNLSKMYSVDIFGAVDSVASQTGTKSGESVEKIRSDVFERLLSTLDDNSAFEDDADDAATILNEMKFVRTGVKSKRFQQGLDRAVKPGSSKFQHSPGWDRFEGPQHNNDRRSKNDDIDFSGIPVNLFTSGKRLGLFDVSMKDTASTQIPLWSKLQNENDKKLLRVRNRNAFEEMVEWTEDEKIWPFPVDNDYKSSELEYNFHDHVFFDEHLEDGFPKDGPIRHFMELVLHGLSLNSTMTVEQKLDHIDWFKRFFTEKESEIVRLHAKSQ